MHHVRRGHVDDVDIGMVDDRAPVLDGLTEANPGDRLLTPLGDVVAADDQGGVEGTLREQRRDAGGRAGVGLAHPAETDDADAEYGTSAHWWFS